MVHADRHPSSVCVLRLFNKMIFESLQAIWTGGGFLILYDSETDGMCTWVG